MFLKGEHKKMYHWLQISAVPQLSAAVLDEWYRNWSGFNLTESKAQAQKMLDNINQIGQLAEKDKFRYISLLMAYLYTLVDNTRTPDAKKTGWVVDQAVQGLLDQYNLVREKLVSFALNAPAITAASLPPFTPPPVKTGVTVVPITSFEKLAPLELLNHMGTISLGGRIKDASLLRSFLEFLKEADAAAILSPNDQLTSDAALVINHALSEFYHDMTHVQGFAEYELSPELKELLKQIALKLCTLPNASLRPYMDKFIAAVLKIKNFVDLAPEVTKVWGKNVVPCLAKIPEVTLSSLPNWY